jgi:hypothetical protein
MALVLAAAFALSIPMAAVVKAEDTTVIKRDRDRDFDRDKIIIKKKEPRHLYMEKRTTFTSTDTGQVWNFMPLASA